MGKKCYDYNANGGKEGVKKEDRNMMELKKEVHSHFMTAIFIGRAKVCPSLINGLPRITPK